MVGSRRHLLLLLSGAVSARFAHPKITLAQIPTGQQPSGPPGQPGGVREPETPPIPPSATKAFLKERQKNIKKDIDRLFELATELKAAVEKTDSTAVLSVAMIKKAEEIEKLARQIKEYAKG